MAPSAARVATINDSPCQNPPGYNATDPYQSVIITDGQPADPGPGTVDSDADPYFDICSYLPSSDGGDGHTPPRPPRWAAPTSGARCPAPA